MANKKEYKNPLKMVIILILFLWVNWNNYAWHITVANNFVFLFSHSSRLCDCLIEWVVQHLIQRRVLEGHFTSLHMLHPRSWLLGVVELKFQICALLNIINKTILYKEFCSSLQLFIFEGLAMYSGIRIE